LYTGVKKNSGKGYIRKEKNDSRQGTNTDTQKNAKQKVTNKRENIVWVGGGEGLR